MEDFGSPRHRGDKPIMSYGVILYTITPDNEIKFLLYQRRDSFEYMDYMRGYWSTKDDIYRLFELMSPEERERVQNFTFDELWDDLWVNHTYRIYEDGYKSAKRKYDYSRSYINHALETTQSMIENPPWGFPKGKKNNSKENELTCALREFKEETKLDARIDVKGFTYKEKFRGTNGRIYSTVYYLASTDNMITPDLMVTPSCIRKKTISEEASNVLWFSYEEALTKLNPIRRCILEKVKNDISCLIS